MLTKWKRLFFLIILTLFVAKAISSDEFNATTTSYKEIESLDYRLPNSVIPTHYELTLMVSPELSTRGTVKIKAIVQEETNKIVLHYGKLNIKVTSVLLKLKQLAIKTTAYNPITEKYSITLQNVVKENTEIIIVIVYSGEAQHDLKGFYKMNYFNKKGEPKYVINFNLVFNLLLFLRFIYTISSIIQIHQIIICILLIKLLHNLPIT